MEKFFNIAGPIKKKLHYALPQRLNAKEIVEFIDRQNYFILHAPRQTGKTTAILGMIDALKEKGNYIPLYVNVEPAQAGLIDVTCTHCTHNRNYHKLILIKS